MKRSPRLAKQGIYAFYMHVFHYLGNQLERVGYHGEMTNKEERRGGSPFFFFFGWAG